MPNLLTSTESVIPCLTSKFLRRIESNPSADLATRKDLYHYQFVAGLSASEWERLVQPQSQVDRLGFQVIHDQFVHYYMRKITTVNVDDLFSVILPLSCTNNTIYNLCLINRIRYEKNYPPLHFQDEDWLDFIIFHYDPALKSKFQTLIERHMYNA